MNGLPLFKARSFSNFKSDLALSCAFTTSLNYSTSLLLPLPPLLVLLPLSMNSNMSNSRGNLTARIILAFTLLPTFQKNLTMFTVRYYGHLVRRPTFCHSCPLISTTSFKDDSMDCYRLFVVPVMWQASFVKVSILYSSSPVGDLRVYFTLPVMYLFTNSPTAPPWAIRAPVIEPKHSSASYYE